MIYNPYTDEEHSYYDLKCPKCGHGAVFVVPAPLGLANDSGWVERKDGYYGRQSHRVDGCLVRRLQCAAMTCEYEWWSRHSAVSEKLTADEVLRMSRDIFPLSPYVC